MRWLRWRHRPRLVQTELRRIWQEPDGRWFFTVEQYPYATADRFVTYGPFGTEGEAVYACKQNLQPVRL